VLEAEHCKRHLEKGTFANNIGKVTLKKGTLEK
jgi:hypothetical protein